MNPFRVHILGCGSATPTANHWLSSQVVEIRDKCFMVDCGEGTQLLLRRHHLRFTKLQAVFISHLHGDHCFGLMGLISTFGLLGRTADLHVYAHKNLGPMLHEQLKLFCSTLTYNIVFHNIDTEKSSTVYEDGSLSIETIPLNHRVPCCGFLFREKPTLPHIDRAACDFYGVPMYMYQAIKEGSGFKNSEGTLIPSSRLTTPPVPPRSYAYCSDTAYYPKICKQIAGADLLYHEATYADDKIDNARKYCHSTARQAGMIAKEANVKRLVLGHFSARYEDESVLQREAGELFPNVLLAREGMVLEV